MKKALLKAENVYKSFGATKAVNDFSIEICEGEVHGLIGENGSGKSTFSSCVAGVYPMDAGTLLLDGEAFAPGSTAEASERGVALVIQEAGVIDSISVAANIFLNKEKRFQGKLGIDSRRMNEAAKKAMHEIDVDFIRPDDRAAALNLEEKKLVEIAKAMSDRPKLLIIDETSNALTTKGRSILYKVIGKVKDYGGSVIFITHDLDELKKICDSVTIMRDGHFIATLPKEEMELKRIRSLMVGREIADNFYRTDTEKSYEDEVVLTAEHLVAPELDDISFELHKGEILGVAGLSESGMHDLGRALFGLEKLDSGSVTVADGTVIADPITAVSKKIGYMSKNRDREALLLQFPIGENICLPSLPALQKGAIIRRKDEKTLASVWAEKLSIKMRSLRSFASTLSGGNKQKVVLAKWMANGSIIHVMDCPTRGIDIGVKEAIYRLLEELKREGRSVVIISEELTELIGMCDRILVMNNYRIAAEFDRSAALDEKTLINYMI